MIIVEYSIHLPQTNKAQEVVNPDIPSRTRYETMVWRFLDCRLVNSRSLTQLYAAVLYVEYHRDDFFVMFVRTRVHRGCLLQRTLHCSAREKYVTPEYVQCLSTVLSTVLVIVLITNTEYCTVLVH
jgi:hypothetical protein